MRFVRTRIKDSQLLLHWLLSREHAHSGNVNTAQAETHCATWQQAYTKYGSRYQFAGTVDTPLHSRMATAEILGVKRVSQSTTTGLPPWAITFSACRSLPLSNRINASKWPMPR